MRKDEGLSERSEQENEGGLAEKLFEDWGFSRLVLHAGKISQGLETRLDFVLSKKKNVSWEDRELMKKGRIGEQ